MWKITGHKGSVIESDKQFDSDNLNEVIQEMVNNGQAEVVQEVSATSDLIPTIKKALKAKIACTTGDGELYYQTLYGALKITTLD